MSDAPIIDLQKYIDAIDGTETIHVRGRVTEVTGLIIKATVPGARIGEMCYIVGAQGHRIVCEVVGFRDEQVMLMPLGEAHGVGPDCEVLPSGKPFSIRCGWSLLGRVVDGLGRPMDGGPEIDDMEEWSVQREAPDPMSRARVTEHLAMGVRAIDGLLTVGLGSASVCLPALVWANQLSWDNWHATPKPISSSPVWSASAAARYVTSSKKHSAKRV